MSRNQKIAARQTNNRNQVITEFQGAVYSGPLPQPEDFARYEEILPGAAERIMGMTESQHELRSELQRQTRIFETKYFNRGQWFGFIISITALGVAAYIAKSGSPIGGTILGTLSIGTIVGSFLYSRNHK